MIKKTEKKGAEKLISIYWFVILFIVAAAVVYMVISFYGKPYDVRELEANILTNKIAECLSVKGVLRDDALSDAFKESFLTECEINFGVEDIYDWKRQGQYYVQVEFLDFGTKTKVSSMGAGNIGLKDFCIPKSDNSPLCLEKSLYVTGKSGIEYQVKILSIVRKTEKNV